MKFIIKPINQSICFSLITIEKSRNLILLLQASPKYSQILYTIRLLYINTATCPVRLISMNSYCFSHRFSYTMSQFNFLSVQNHNTYPLSSQCSIMGHIKRMLILINFLHNLLLLLHLLFHSLTTWPGCGRNSVSHSGMI